MQLDMISSIVGVPPSTFLVAGLTLLLTTVYFLFKRKNLPPGPIGLPYLGYWPFFKNEECHLKLEDLKKKYGAIFSFTCTGRLYINLGNHKAVREACVTKSEFFGDRISGYNLLSHLFKESVLGVNGEPWKATRKFFLTALKERGSNTFKTSVAGPLYDSIKKTMTDLKAKDGAPLNLVDVLTQGCCTYLRYALFGEVGITEKQLKKFNELYALEITAFLPKTILLSGTFAKYFIFPFMHNYLTAIKIHDQLQNFVQEIIDEHKKTFDPENPRDIIDEYFKEREKRQSKGDHTAEYFTDQILRGSILQFTGDGALVVASFTSLILKGLLLYPEEQEKLYDEIVEKIGLDRQPTIEDKSQLTYFNAYLQESMRMQDFFNFFPTQECTRETTLGGYRIPKGAILLQNFYSSHFDPTVYSEPEKFKPSRYIQVDGKRKEEPPIMFGIGKRSCIGESYVMTQAFLLLVTLIQNFQLSRADTSKISVETFANSRLLVSAKPRDKH